MTEGISFHHVIENQRSFFFSGKTLPLDFRKQQLRKFRKALNIHSDNLTTAIREDFGKSGYETLLTELGPLYNELTIAEKKLAKWGKPISIATNMATWPAKSTIIPEPYGVTLIIGAWNYPINLTLIPLVSAIAAGNTVILKPSELSTRTARSIKNMITDAFDPEYITVVEGGIEETTGLLKERYDKIFFTGSVPVGRIVYQAAAQHLTPVTLELGGKSPAIILQDADLPLTVKRLVWGKFLNAGQTCVAPDYVYVHTSIKNTFLDLVKKEISLYYPRVIPLPENYVRIINQKNLDRVAGLIDQEKIITGGTVYPEERIIEPTVMSDVTWDDQVMKQEIFGPIMPVLEYEDIENIILRIKQQPKPLACYIFTKNKTVKNHLLRQISFGGGCVNDTIMHLANDNLPFGGVGESGIGTYHGHRGFEAFSHYKSVLEKSLYFDFSIRYFPYAKWKKTVLSWLMK